MVGESDQNVFLIHKDASNFAEFEISEFEISRFDCILSALSRPQRPDYGHYGIDLRLSGSG